jgi:hypothetical protein
MLKHMVQSRMCLLCDAESADVKTRAPKNPRDLPGWVTKDPKVGAVFLPLAWRMCVNLTRSCNFASDYHPKNMINIAKS